MMHFRTIFGMMINPAGTVKEAVAKTHWYFALAVSGTAFGLFFLQTGLDLYKVGQKDFSFVIIAFAIGILYGLLVIPLIGVLSYGILKFTKTDKDLKWAISSFCLSYSGALIYGLIGLIVSLTLDWRTAVAFGVSGVIWAVGPLIVSAREMANNNLKVSIPLVTFFSTLVLLSWSLLTRM